MTNTNASGQANHSGLFKGDNETGASRVALITGSARRIGASIAKMLHQQGYNVIIHYHRSKQDAEHLVDALQNLRANSAIALQADLQNLDDLAQLCTSSVAQWGHVDLLINNASCFFPTPVQCKPDDPLPFNMADWNTLIDTNLRAPYYLSLALADSLRQRAGAIINLVDIYSERPLKDHSIYTISKSGIAMMTKSLARELAPEIRVNGVSPGAILWPEHNSDVELQDALKARIISQTPLARCGTPNDICDAVKYLASSEFVTGQIISVDGGRSLYL